MPDDLTEINDPIFKSKNVQEETFSDFSTVQFSQLRSTKPQKKTGLRFVILTAVNIKISEAFALQDSVLCILVTVYRHFEIPVSSSRTNQSRKKFGNQSHSHVMAGGPPNGLYWHQNPNFIVN